MDVITTKKKRRKTASFPQLHKYLKFGMDPWFLFGLSIIARAVTDRRNGCPEAERWLRECGAYWLDTVGCDDSGCLNSFLSSLN